MVINTTLFEHFGDGPFDDRRMLERLRNLTFQTRRCIARSRDTVFTTQQAMRFIDRMARPLVGERNSN
jgi:hypothetical protein